MKEKVIFTTVLCLSAMTPMVAAKRELMEETGFGGGNCQKWMTISANPSTHTNLTHCYLATDVERMDVQHLDKAEISRFASSQEKK